MSVNDIGQKGLGLLSIPSLWSLPFICIDSTVFTHYTQADESGKKDLIATTAKHIRNELDSINVSDFEPIMIRSSGVEEGMQERGQLESLSCHPKEIEKTLTCIFDSILNSEYNAPIAFVIQKEVSAIITGHLSNERRFTSAKRDWIYECYDNNDKPVDSGKIGIRYWRHKPIPDKTIAFPLSCCRASDIKEVLKIVAEYYTVKKQEIHFEFLWDGQKIYLVQADVATENNTGKENPLDYNITVSDIADSLNFKVLRLANDTDSRFSKVANHLLYRKVGLQTVPLYILDNREYIEQLKKQVMPSDLEADLKLLVKNSIVIRTDIVSSDIETKQLLGRSNELRKYEDVCDWLFQQECLHQDNADIAFLFHIFIPARAAAFVKATPSDRIVEIEALWGLPEGLYYNAHDKIIVDTKAVNTDFLAENIVEIKKKKPGYKEHFIAPNDQGMWVAKKTARPCDWQLCIDDSSIKQISVESRKIAAFTGKQLSIMWFIGIDKAYYGTSNLAWYHEEISPSSYTASHYKRKYFRDAEMIIQNEEDYELFLDNSNVKQVKICPTEDVLLRDKEFLRKVGLTAKERNASIILEGGMLTHPLYQLLNTGAHVLIPDADEIFGEDETFNKLVRDRIPDIIISNGEDVQCYKLERDALLRALMEKSVEEAYEINTAQTNDSLIEELADEYEVLQAIQSVLEESLTISVYQRKIRTPYNGILIPRKPVFSADIDLCMNNCRRTFSVPLASTISLYMNCNKSELQIELLLSKVEKDCSEDYIKPLNSEIDTSYRTKILEDAFLLSSTRNIDEAKTLVANLLYAIEEIRTAETEFDKATFDCIVSKKSEKRGRFEKGYMLQSSTLTASSSDDQQSIDIPRDGFPTKYILDFPVIKNVDYLEKEGGKLLLRVSAPICLDELQLSFSSNSVKRYIGIDKRIIMSLVRNGCYLTLTVFIDESSETVGKAPEQLIIDGF